MKFSNKIGWSSIVFAVIIVFAFSQPNVKQNATIFTVEKVANARANSLKYSWANDEKVNVVSKADSYLQDLSLQQIFDLVTAASIPRSYSVNVLNECLNCGSLISPYGLLPYGFNVVQAPWKITCSCCKFVFPTNDFQSFYQGGLDSNGIFSWTLAKAYDDKLISNGGSSNLINTLYPEKGAQWGVDDGFGYVAEDGTAYTYVAYYNHWALWYKTDVVSYAIGKTGIIMDILDTCSNAYLFTGNTQYSDAAFVILARVSELYPFFQFKEIARWSDEQKKQYPSEFKGKITDRIWECELVERLIINYDAVFPAIRDLSAEARTIIRPCVEKMPGYNLEQRLQLSVENNILRQVLPNIQSGNIRGNMGMHQSTLLAAAVVLDLEPETSEWINFILRDNTLPTGGLCSINGGDAVYMLTNLVDNDGFGNEASPLYNSHWERKWFDVAKMFYEYGGKGQVFLEHPKLQKLLLGSSALVMHNCYTPSIGDSGSAGKPEIYADLNRLIACFLMFPNKEFASAIESVSQSEKLALSDLHYDLFAQNPYALKADISKFFSSCMQPFPEDYNFTDFGLARFHAAPQIDGWLYYGKTTGHGHQDALNLGLYSYGLDLLPDLGYPSDTTYNEERFSWGAHTLSHNTVTIDDRPQQKQTIGQTLIFDSDGEIKVASFSALDAYPDADTYQRTLLSIPLDSQNAYLIDIFEVSGGNKHTYSFHIAGESPAILQDSSSAVLLKNHNKKLEITQAQWLSSLTFYDYPVSGGWSALFQIQDNWNVFGNGVGKLTDYKLKFTMLNAADRIYTADGKAPDLRKGNPVTLPYVFVERTANTGKLESTFVSILEPYQSQSLIDRIQFVSADSLNKTPTSSNSLAIQVKKIDNGEDYIIYSPEGEDLLIDNKFNFSGTIGVVSYSAEGDITYRYLYESN